MLRPFGTRCPRVHPTALIDDSAQIIGNVEIDREASVSEIPPGSLVMGSPGRVRRSVSANEMARIVESAEHYAAYRLRYQSP